MNSIASKACIAFFLGFLTCSGIASTSDIATLKGSAELSVDLNYEFKLTNVPSSAKQVFAWIPIPVSNKWQTCENYHVKGDRPYTVVTDNVFGNRFLRFDYAQRMKTGEVDEIITEVTFRTTRKSFHLLNENIQGEMISKTIPEGLYLSANRLIPISGKIADEAMTIADTDKKPLHQARQLFDHIVRSVTYDKSGMGWGKGDADYACDVRKGNCTDFHSLFIGETRSLKIPSRFIMGIPIPESKNEGTIAGYHCWAEFYIEDRGWVPIDASEASKFRVKQDMFFGGLDENRVQFTIGRDIHLPLAQSGPVNYAIYPHVEIDGELSNEVETTFRFQKL